MIDTHGSLPVPALSPQDIALLQSIVDEGSFTAAADRLDITQSAVSRAVAHLEHVLKTDLFHRGRRGAAPTAALRSVLPRMREVEKEMRAIACDLARSDEAAFRGPIRIAGFRSAVGVLLPPAVSKFMRRHRDVRVSLSAVREQGAGVVQSLEDGTADFAITTVKPPSRFRSAYLGSDRYVAIHAREAASRSHAMENLVLWRERCSEVVPQILRAHNWTVSNRVEVDSDTAVLAMVAHGSGFAIMPELAVEPLPAAVQKITLANEFRRHVWLCGLANTFESRIGRVLSRYIHEAAGQWLTK